MQEHRRRRSASPTAEKAFGTVLREIRKEREISQETLAFESGYHSTYIGQLERGQKSPSLRTIMNLAVALDTPGSEMLRRVELRIGRVEPKRQRLQF
jgi:transcriptional regulator with XRE-family HTH domain